MFGQHQIQTRLGEGVEVYRDAEKGGMLRREGWWERRGRWRYDLPTGDLGVLQVFSFKVTWKKRLQGRRSASIIADLR